MPPQQGFWLDKDQSLSPSLNHLGQEDEKHPICFRACGPFHLAPENDELVS